MPQITQYIFNRKKLASILNHLSVESLAEHTTPSDIRQRIENWCSLIARNVLDGKNEISLQDSFLSDFFGKILDYKFIHESSIEWHLYREKKTVTDATRSDAALGFFTGENEDVRVIIELKEAKSNLDAKQNRKGANYTPVEQAFLYSGKFSKKCKWVIVSNYKEIRLYNRNASMNEYESFQIEDLKNETELKRFLYLLSRKNLIEKDKQSLIDELCLSNEAEQEKISKEFYNKYKRLRVHLFEYLKEKNSDIAELVLLEKTQKILDRFIFICYCEDFGLLPERIFRKMMEAVKNPLIFANVSQWDQLKNLFSAINQGSPAHHINKFNGGLFEYDEILDGRLMIGDEIFEALAEISDYDFDSELNVNVLGHIFEQSISDIEEIKASIAGESFDKKKGKRKKEGIYYTPEYITRYIVEQAVGGWLEDRKKELGFEALPELTQSDFDSVKYYRKTGGIKSSNKNIKDHLDFWQNYKEKLSNIKVLDPACGSGAFLNQAFDYLYKEGQHVNDEIAKLRKGQIEVFRLDEHILKNNLFGVDLNPESVEITKLSLWLKTADRNSELTALDDNIKCGNSLIDDPQVAGERAFKWEDNFPEVMKNGGFDVVVGNPPYVRQELLTPYKFYFEKHYVCYSGTGDLFTYFYEKSLNLLKDDGYFGFISNTFAKTSGAGTQLRKFLKHHCRIISIADFSEQKIFEGITTYPIIPILKKEKSYGVFNYLKVKSEDLLTLSSSVKMNSLSVNQSSLKDEGWSFESVTKRNLKEKIQKNPTVRELFGKCYRGILTGCNESFIISGEQRREIIAENPEAAEFIKPFLEGKDLNKWACFDADKWLILFPKGWTSNISGLEKEEEAWKYLINHYPGISSHLTKYKDKAVERHDKGVFWWELRACNYYDFFESPKIVWPNLQSVNKFSFDTEGFYINAPSVILPSDNKALLCIVNSKLAWFFFKDICVIRSGGYVEMKPQYFEQLPIALPADEQPFIEKADIMLSKRKELHELKHDFLRFLESELKPQKISKKLENWDESDWDGFKAELAKCKVRIQGLSLKERKEWQAYFAEQKEKAAEIRSVIEKTDREIDQMVYKLYGLTNEEIQLVEKSR